MQLRRLREARGWTLDDVVDGLHRVAGELGEPAPGVDRQAVSRWERGVHRPRPHYIRLLSALYGSSPVEMGLIDPETEPAASGRAHSSMIESEARITTPSQLGADAAERLVRGAGNRSELPHTAPDEGQWGRGKGERGLDALARSGMLEWLGDAIGVKTSELGQVINARSTLANGSSLPAISQERLAAKVLGFYGPDAFAQAGFTPYRFHVGGHAHITTVATRSEWIGLWIPLPANDASGHTARCHLVGSPASELRMHDVVTEGALNRLARQVAAGDQAPLMIERPLYDLNALAVDDRGLEATFSVGSFAHYALTYDLLEDEAVAAALDPQWQILPIRSRLMPDLNTAFALDRRLCAGGVDSLTAIARPATRTRPADFLLPIQERSAKVLNVRRSLTVIPKAFHQHLVDPAEEVPLAVTVRRELEEELFGREDVDDSRLRRGVPLSPYHRRALSEPMRWLDELPDSCSLQCTAAGIDLLSGTYAVATVIVIDDERFWEEFGGSCVPNWEATGVQVFSSHDESGLASLLSNARWDSQGLFTLVEGLRQLARRFPERVTLPSQLEVGVGSCEFS